MKPFLVAIVVSPFVLATCAIQQTASMSATPDSDPGYMNVKDGKRQEVLVGSRLPRESRENAEVTKTVSRRAYEEAKIEKPDPMPGGR